MPKTKQIKEQAESASPIEYRFKYRLHRNKEGEPTGLVFLIFSAMCSGVPIYKFEKTIYFRELTPSLDQKLNCFKVIKEKEMNLATR